MYTQPLGKLRVDYLFDPRSLVGVKYDYECKKNIYEVN